MLKTGPLHADMEDWRREDLQSRTSSDRRFIGHGSMALAMARKNVGIIVAAAVVIAICLLFTWATQ